MPRPKPWLANIPRIIKLLEEQPEASFTRRDVEQIFGIARSAANELMNVAGTRRLPSPDGSALVTAGNLLLYLRHSPEAVNAVTELVRRQKLATKLQKASEEQKLRRIAIRVTSADEWCKLSDLPNVSIEDGVLRVAFNSPEELMADLYRLAKAAGNDIDGFRKLCSPPAAPDPPTPETAMAAEGENEKL